MRNPYRVIWYGARADRRIWCVQRAGEEGWVAVRLGPYQYRCTRCHRERCGHVEAVMDYEREQEYREMLAEGIRHCTPYPKGATR